MVVKLPFNMFWCGAFTCYPWIFVSKDVEPMRLLLHETVHINQQGAWFKKAWVFGLLAWWFLYMLVLPVGWNPWRKQWETEAFLAEGFKPERIKEILKGMPYWLWR